MTQEQLFDNLLNDKPKTFQGFQTETTLGFVQSDGKFYTSQEMYDGNLPASAEDLYRFSQDNPTHIRVTTFKVFRVDTIDSKGYWNGPDAKTEEYAALYDKERFEEKIVELNHAEGCYSND